METPNRVRGAILYILKLYLERDRTGEDGEDAYMLEGNLLAHLSQYYRIRLSEGELRSHMAVLKDKAYAIYKERKVGIPPRQHTELFWRITADGILILSGEHEDSIVTVPRWVR
jgi:hypothetical protein